MTLLAVIPVKTGIQCFDLFWMPAFASMTAFFLKGKMGSGPITLPITAQVTATARSASFSSVPSVANALTFALVPFHT